MIELNGNTAAIGQPVVLASGAIVTLRADGTFDYDPNGAFDSLAPGTVTTDGFNYTVSDNPGASTEGTDIASVIIEITTPTDTDIGSPPTIDLDFQETVVPIPGQGGFTLLNFSDEGESGFDGQSEAQNGGDGEFLRYNNVGTIDGQDIDIVAVA